MQLVEHDALERGGEIRSVVGGQQQRQLLRRGQQNIRRIAPLPLPPRYRRVAGAGLDLDRQTHLANRRFQIARDIDRERLQRRDVEGVEAAAALQAARLRSLPPCGGGLGRGVSRSARCLRLTPPPPPYGRRPPPQGGGGPRSARGWTQPHQ